MEFKKFSVLFFPSDNSIEVVPSKWISEDKKTCPFPLAGVVNFKELQKDSNSSPDPSWPIWEVVVKKTYGK